MNYPTAQTAPLVTIDGATTPRWQMICPVISNGHVQRVDHELGEPLYVEANKVGPIIFLRLSTVAEFRKV